MVEEVVTTLYISRLVSTVQEYEAVSSPILCRDKKTRTRPSPTIKINCTDQAPGQHIGAVERLEAHCPTVHMATGQYSSGHYGRDPSPEGYKEHCTVWTPLGKIRCAHRRNSQRENG